MPWRTTTEVLERTRFVLEAERGEWTISQLCRRYGISRTTAYRWISRYKSEGLAGLEERSRRPKRSPNATDPVMVALLVAERKAHPHWGPRKLLARLRRKHPDLELPARSTAALLLKREGLVSARARRRRPLAAGPGGGFGAAERANTLWTVDFKGEFRLGDGRLCYPLTIQDARSRYLVALEVRRSTRTEEARPVFERAFLEFGLPDRIGSDNGPPFGSQAILGLSRLSVWWLKLGIGIERIDPGHPEQNGRHERLHRTLKAEAVPRRPPCPDGEAQQALFDRFRVQYNEERPHEALSDAYPADYYRPSWRPYRDETPGLDYPAHFERRQVRRDGCMKWQGRLVFVSEVLAHEPVGLEETDEGVWSIYFGPLVLGRICDGERRITPGAQPAHSDAKPSPSRPREKGNV